MSPVPEGGASYAGLGAAMAAAATITSARAPATRVAIAVMEPVRIGGIDHPVEGNLFAVVPSPHQIEPLEHIDWHARTGRNFINEPLHVVCPTNLLFHQHRAGVLKIHQDNIERSLRQLCQPIPDSVDNRFADLASARRH
jgi:hypothetical protein